MWTSQARSGSGTGSYARTGNKCVLATHQAAADRTGQISNLYTSLLPLSPLQGQISSSLDYVEAQQKDLSDILDSYEAQIGDLVDQSSTSNGWRGNSGMAEKEREKA